ncbi:MAG: hypothetical protein JWP63_6381 [Candidatus Solibacter sp.]|nr:hypothetical protein [Candidatus Solibacter sp.]
MIHFSTSPEFWMGLQLEYDLIAPQVKTRCVQLR